jgi:hypothetical protein
VSGVREISLVNHTFFSFVAFPFPEWMGLLNIRMIPASSSPSLLFLLVHLQQSALGLFVDEVLSKRPRLAPQGRQVIDLLVDQVLELLAVC